MGDLVQWIQLITTYNLNNVVKILKKRCDCNNNKDGLD